MATCAGAGGGPAGRRSPCRSALPPTRARPATSSAGVGCPCPFGQGPATASSAVALGPCGRCRRGMPRRGETRARTLQEHSSRADAWDMGTPASGKQSAGHRLTFGGPLTIGLLLILLVGTVTVGSALMRAAAVEAAHAVSVNEVLQRAALAVSTEESLERKYLLEPGPEARDAHAAAEDALDAAMAELLTSPDPADRELAEHVRYENVRYVAASAKLFNARDNNATDEQIEAVDSEQIDPVFTALEEEVT